MFGRSCSFLSPFFNLLIPAKIILTFVKSQGVILHKIENSYKFLGNFQVFSLNSPKTLCHMFDYFRTL